MGRWGDDHGGEAEKGRGECGANTLSKQESQIWRCRGGKRLLDY